MKQFAPALALLLCIAACSQTVASPAQPAPAPAKPAVLAWPASLPVYDHIVIVVEENKDYDQIIGSHGAPFLNGVLRADGASLTRMFAEEHHSEGNYFWLFSGSNQGVGFEDKMPRHPFDTPNLGASLIRAGRTFAGYAEDLPAIGSQAKTSGLYARKHIPWVSFTNVPDGSSAATSGNLRFPQDFPADFSTLPTVSFVIPNLVNDMHNGDIPQSVAAGDTWLRDHLAVYYAWAKTHNSLLIVTFDENDHASPLGGLTDPSNPDARKANRIVTLFAGARIRHGEYAEGPGVTHVNLLRTIEAMYGLPKSGAQAPNAVRAGISNDFLITDVFEPHP